MVESEASLHYRPTSNLDYLVVYNDIIVLIIIIITI